MDNSRGFTLVEMLIACSLICVILPLLPLSIRILTQIKPVEIEYSDIEIACKQLSQELMEGYDISTTGDTFVYTKNDQSFKLYLDDRRLVKSEGFEIYLFDVDELYFTLEDFIMIHITRGSKTYKRVIGVLT